MIWDMTVTTDAMLLPLTRRPMLLSKKGKAKSLLEEHNDKLHKVAERLMEVR